MKKKISEFFIWKFSFFGGKIFSIFEQACFRNADLGLYSSLTEWIDIVE